MSRIQLILVALWLLGSAALAQDTRCVPINSQQLIIYRAGSLNSAFNQLAATFTCQTGIQVKDTAMGSVDAARQITAGGHPCDLYAPADYMDIDLFLKPAGLADFNIVFAQGKIVLMYSASGVAEKKLPPLAAPNDPPFHPPASIPKAAANWYEILTMSGVVIGGGHPFLDPGAYRTHMIFQLAQDYYHLPNLYNDLLEHLTISGPLRLGPALGKQIDFQFIYEHSAELMASGNPDIRYVNLPDEINLSDPTKDSWYAQHASIVIPGLGTPGDARMVSIPATRVAWGITILKNAPNPESAVKFLQLLLSPDGTAVLKKNGPAPISPAVVRPDDFQHLPKPLRALVKERKAPGSQPPSGSSPFH